MEIKTVNDLYRIARDICAWNDFVGPSSRSWCHGFRLPRIVCADGFSVSCQAGANFYSMPREDLEDEYFAFELGYPSEREELLDEYTEHDPELWLLYEKEPMDYTKQVYPYVPVEVVNAVIEKHGGIHHLGK